PSGVHGPSRIIDHSAFEWHDRGWNAPVLSSGVIYELHVGTFTAPGTFDAVIERLGHLLELGITHVELMPVAEFSGNRGWGYDGVDLFAPHHAYGGPDGLKRLVDACHRRGLAIILDVVYNHFGPEGNYLPQFGPYLTSRYATPWGSAVNFDDRGSDEVRRFVCDNAKMWLHDYHFDGLRIDAIHSIVDTSAIQILEQLSAEVAELEKSLGRSLVLIAESDLNDPRIVRHSELGGYNIQAQWSDDFHHALHSVLTRETSGYYGDFGLIKDIADALQRVFVYDGRYSKFRARRHGRKPTGLSGHSFLGYLQNHDQIGNRAPGERSSNLMSIGLLQVAAALVLTAPFIPMLFQGEEWGAASPFIYFTGHENRELGQAVSEGRKKELMAAGWKLEDIPDPQAIDSFTRSKLDWHELEREPHKSILRWHQDLIRLRKSRVDLYDGDLAKVHVEYDEQARWLLMTRGSIHVACNFVSEPRRIGWSRKPKAELLLKSNPAVQLETDYVDLSGESVAIIAT
ncbi:MAG TPA: malto-oligosyltrehalose trehalohydrolase, partial [Candidatus Binataceae bacterium]|nr:malto-oligosyltrehalose trehalohydrolase [Candidatus Binataceae bacterium]